MTADPGHCSSTLNNIERRLAGNFFGCRGAGTRREKTREMKGSGVKTFVYVFMAFVVNPGRGDFDESTSGICLKTETYESTVYVHENVKVPEIKKEWCWDISKGFKCPRTTYKWEARSVPKKLKRTKMVKACCDGYAEDKEHWKFSCIPQCSRGCGLHGICFAPEVCSCKPGWRGHRCESQCPVGFRGAECEERFDCVDESCDSLTTTTEEEKTSTTEATVTTTDVFTTESQTEDSYSDTETTTTESMETTSTESIETTTVESIEITSTDLIETTPTESIKTTTAGTTPTTEFATLEQVETTSVTETTEGTTETSTEETSTVQEIISGRKSSGSFGSYRRTYGNESEESNRNKLPEEPQVPTTTTKISEEEGGGGRDVFGSDHRELGATENGKKESSRLVYFVPSLTVLSGVSVLIFLIATRWLIAWHRRKVRKMAVEVEEKIYHPDGQRKCRIESIFLANEYTESPVYVSAPYLQNKAPVLQTFKPLEDSTTKGRSDAN